MKKLLSIVLVIVVCIGLLSACGQTVPQESTPTSENTPPVVETPTTPEPSDAAEPEPSETVELGQTYDLFDYLYELPMDGTDEEFDKIAQRNYRFIQSIEPIVTEESFFTLYAASVHLRQRADGAREEFAQALKSLVLECPVSETVYFLWDDGKMPMLDGESFTEEELDASAQDYYGFAPFLLKRLLDDPTTAKGNIIVVSGGGMSERNNDIEGYPAIKAFNNLGYNVFVLQRRVRPYSDQDIYMDTQRAIRIVKYYAEKEGWGGQDMIAASGWSGGSATVAGTVNTLYGFLNPTKYDSDYVPDEIDAINSDLDVAILIYGGPSASGLEDTNPNRPAYYMSAGTEDMYDADIVIQEMYDEFIARGEEAKIRIFEGAGHGFGVGDENGKKTTPECAEWPAEADEFMQAHLGYSKK